MKRRIRLASLLFLLPMLLSACGKELQSVYVQPVSVIMGYGSAGDFTVTAGVVTARGEIDIRRDENRTVAQCNVEAGQTVSAGDVLFTYDMEAMQLQLDKAELEIEQLRNSVTDLTAQIAQLEKEKLSAGDSAQLSYTVQIQSLQTDQKETEYNIGVKERELETMRTAAENAEVTSPIDGKVKSVNEDGMDPNTGETLPYITLIEEGAYRVKGKVNEMNRDSLYVGMPVVVRSRTVDTLTWSGTIAEIDTENPESDNNSYYYMSSDEMTSTSSYPFYVDLDNTNGLMLGEHVYIEPFGGEQPEGLWLDASYVVATETGNYVWAADKNNKMEKREVTIGQRDEDGWRFEILDGLTLDDRIAYPADDISEGAPAVDTYNDDNNVSDGDIFDDLPEYADNNVDNGDGDFNNAASEDIAWAVAPVEAGGGY